MTAGSVPLAMMRDVAVVQVATNFGGGAFDADETHVELIAVNVKGDEFPDATPCVGGLSIAVGDRLEVVRWFWLCFGARLVAMFSIHATKKLLDRVKRPVLPAVSEPATILGNWYANVLFWKPQVALLVNERTLLPVLMPLAPAATLSERFPEALQRVLEALEVTEAFIEVEIDAMVEGRYAKTVNRSVIGIMNEFRFLAEVYRAHRGFDDLVALAVELSNTPCGPLYKRHGSPDRELDAVVAGWSGSEQDNREALA